MNPATALATVLVDELVRCGVTDAVLSPGSRSAPLALALDAHPALRLHVRIDERSAAFLALGLAKASGRPVPVVCTSGTAAANLHPAVLEADSSGVALLVLTADRPPELRATGANQTTDQIKLYGPAVRFFAEVGVPEARAGAAAYWRSLVCRAVAYAHDGPVHLNLALREPLVPDGDTAWPSSLAGRAGGEPWTAVAAPVPHPVAVDAPERGVVIAGDGARDPAAAVAFAEAAGWPVLAEPTSNARYGPNAMSCHAYLLRSPALRERLRPEAIVTVGKPSLSRQVLALYDAGIPHTVVHPGQDWPDPSRTASRVVGALALPGASRPASAWLAAWREVDRAGCAAIDAVLDASGELTEARLVRDLVAGLPSGSLLTVGASMPARWIDVLMRPRKDLLLLANRGLSGIDGTVSTLLGQALAHQRGESAGRGFGLLGDLTFLHDQNGLLLGPDEERPDVTLVVVNNDGGGIFSLLPYRGLASGFERLFGTAHGADLHGVATAAGWKFEAVRTPAELPEIVGRGGPLIVEARTDRAAAADLHATLAEAVTQVVSAAL